MRSAVATSLGLLLLLLVSFTPQYPAAYAVSTAAAAATTCVDTNQYPTCRANDDADTGGFVESLAGDHRWVPRGRSDAARLKPVLHSQRRRHRSWQSQAEGVPVLTSGTERDDHDDVVVFVGSCRGGGGDAVSGRQMSTIGDKNSSPARTRATTKGFAHTVKIGLLFTLSYMCSVGFNVNNKRALNLVPLPWSYAAFNLLMGAVTSLVTWSVNAAPWPRINGQDICSLIPVAFLHMVSHLTVVLGLGAGAISFLQTVKAAEACFTAAFSVIFQGQILPLPVYLALLPVVVGVGITSCNQPRFSWVALSTALASNFSNALHNVLIVKTIGPAAAKVKHENNQNTNRSKPAAANGVGLLRTTAGIARTTNVRESSTTGSGGVKEARGLASLGPGDTFRLLTAIGAVLLIPVAAITESRSWGRMWRGAIDAAPKFAERGDGLATMVAGTAAAAAGERRAWSTAARHAVLAAVCWNVFYDLCFRLLGQLHPVTHAVGNTFKRVFVIGAGALAFGGDLGGARGAFGSALAVSGVLLYSIAKINCGQPPDNNGGP